MNDIDTGAFCDILYTLEAEPEIVRELDVWGSKYFGNQKDHVIAWFESQSTKGSGAYSRKKCNTSTRAAYNRLLNPGMLIWIAAVLGVDEFIIAMATAAAKKAEKINYRFRCGVFRDIITFDLILKQLEKPELWKRINQE